MDPVKPDDRGALENTEKAENADDVFDATFDKAAEIEEGKADPPAAPEPVVEKKDPPPADPPKVQAGDDDKADQRYRTLQGMYNKDKETWETERAALLAKAEEAAKAAAPAPKKETEIPKDLELSEEDLQAIKEYDEEFDLVSKMEGKKREIELRKLRKEFQGFVETIKAELTAQLAPTQTFINETVAERAQREELSHFSSIKEAHPDFETYRDDGRLMKWIESKPRYLQKSMLETYNQGTSDDVVDLLNDFKLEHNISSPPRDNVLDINTRKAEKKLAMTAVTTRRGAVNPSHVVASDFEGAFDEALHKGG